jgi:hypothetical protein
MASKWTRNSNGEHSVYLATINGHRGEVMITCARCSYAVPERAPNRYQIMDLHDCSRTLQPCDACEEPTPRAERKANDGICNACRTMFEKDDAT